MKPVFTYGSLMFDPVWTSVVSGRYEKSEATLEGYRRFGVQNGDYPVVKPQVNAQVEGIVYYDVSRQDLKRLDIFEGEYYHRKSVQVLLPHAAVITAEVYVLRRSFYSIVSNQAWDPVWFERQGIRRFMRRYGGFDTSVKGSTER